MLSNGASGDFGYLPSPRQHELGGYETWLTVSHAEVGASPKLVKKRIKRSCRIHLESVEKYVSLPNRNNHRGLLLTKSDLLSSGLLSA